MTSEALLTRSEQWRAQYRGHRYARLLTQEELDKRFRDIFTNLLILTPEAKIGLTPLKTDGPVWIEFFTHVLEEIALRHGPYPGGITRDLLYPLRLPNYVGELGKKAASAIRTKGLRSGQTLIKFGRVKYIRPLFERGALRIQPASFFSSQDHSEAIRDDELAIKFSFAMTREDIVKTVVNPQDVPMQIPDQRADMGLKIPGDYWLYCLSQSAEPRLFVDFDADCCVVIHNQEMFTTRLLQAAAQVLTGVSERHGPVIYVDPLLPSIAQIRGLSVPFAKHFGYSYQKEFRFAWLPKQNSAKLSPVDLEIGSLEEVANLIVL